MAERVAVLGSSFTHVNEAVLFNEEFVTASVLSDKLQELRMEMAQAALVHCRGLRKIAAQQAEDINCELCYEEHVAGFICDSCPKAVCTKCFPMAFQDRVSENAAEVSIEYQCPYCRSTFASFPQVSDVEEPVEA